MREVATTEPRKKSPVSSTARRLGTAAPPAAVASDAETCVAYVPSASTVGRLLPVDAVAAVASALPSIARSSSCSRV